MAPNASEANGVLFESDVATPDLALPYKPVNRADDQPRQLVWTNIVNITSYHLLGVYGLYLFLFHSKWQTNLFAYFLYVISGLGITAGAHRLWSHRSYKAKWPLKLILIIFNTTAFQSWVLEWARDHRMHHKYSETDADPHNATRGVFYSHVGWLFVRKHPELKKRGKGLDLTDLYDDPFVKYQKMFYFILMPLFCFIIPTVVPVYGWNESWTNALLVCGVFRHLFVLNGTWLVNSAAHKWGGKPYDKNINPSDTLPVSIVTLGEGAHNYHHVFPWDYRTAELGIDNMNFTTKFINFFAKIGWAYDLKIVSDDVLQKRVERTGDGTHPQWGLNENEPNKEEITDRVKNE